MDQLGRLLFGGFFMSSGLNHFQNVDMMAGYAGSKGVPRPKEAVLLTGAMLTAGGASVALGLRPDLGALALAGFLVPTTPMMHDFWNQEDGRNDQIHFMKNVALLGACLLLWHHWRPAPAAEAPLERPSTLEVAEGRPPDRPVLERPRATEARAVTP